MSDILGRIREEQDVFGKLLGKLPGFNGYFDREQRSRIVAMSFCEPRS